MDRKLQWAIAKILDFLKPDFYGTITLTFQGGVLQSMKKEETFKVVDLDG